MSWDPPPTSESHWPVETPETMGAGRAADLISKVWPPWPSKAVPKWFHCAMFVLVACLCLTFSGGDIEFEFVLMTSAYSLYLKNSSKQYLALIGR